MNEEPTIVVSRPLVEFLYDFSVRLVIWALLLGGFSLAVWAIVGWYFSWTPDIYLRIGAGLSLLRVVLALNPVTLLFGLPSAREVSS